MSKKWRQNLVFNAKIVVFQRLVYRCKNWWLFQFLHTQKSKKKRRNINSVRFDQCNFSSRLRLIKVPHSELLFLGILPWDHITPVLLTLVWLHRTTSRASPSFLELSRTHEPMRNVLYTIALYWKCAQASARLLSKREDLNQLIRQHESIISRVIPHSSSWANEKCSWVCAISSFTSTSMPCGMLVSTESE